MDRNETRNATGNKARNAAGSGMRNAGSNAARNTKRSEKRRRKQIRRLKLIALISTIALILVVSFGTLFYQMGYTYESRHVEAGTPITVETFLKRPDKDAYLKPDSDPFDSSVPGKYTVYVKAGMFTHECTLYVEDTQAPVVEVQDVNLAFGETCKPESFLKSVTDATQTTAKFVSQPDYASTQPQVISIAVSDAAGNVTNVQGTLNIFRIQPVITIEAGATAFPPITDYVISGRDVQIVDNATGGPEDLDPSLYEYGIDLMHVGTYELPVSVDGVVHNVKVEIVDTQAPGIEVQNLTAYVGNVIDAREFVTIAYDVTGEVATSYETEPDFNREGTQTLVIIGTDPQGNIAKREVTLTLMKDTEPPVLQGVGDIHAWLGDSISYKSGVSVSDNSGREVDLQIDSSKVNTKAEGVYPVTYTATDSSGNVTTVTVNVTLEERVYSEEKLYALVDSALSTIINPSMSNYDKAKKIYDYIRSHVSYVDTSDKSDWVKAAYEGLTSGHGDCFTYACVAKAFLTRAGLKNMDIERIPEGDELHYWNLVDLEDGHGWYHYDTTPRKDHPYIFLWDDATIADYSIRHDNCHNYDKTKYPVIP